MRHVLVRTSIDRIRQHALQAVLKKSSMILQLQSFGHKFLTRIEM